MAGRDGSVQLLVFLRPSPPSKGETVNSTSHLDIGQLHLWDLNFSNHFCFATVLNEFGNIYLIILWYCAYEFVIIDCSSVDRKLP